MKKLILIMVVMLVATGVALAKDVELKEKAGDYTVTAKFDKKPFIGDNKLTVTVTDVSGRAVTDANVKVEYYMKERMSATRKTVEMPYHRAKVEAAAQEGGYRAEVDLYMAGPWHMEVKVTRNGKTSTAKFFINV